MIIRMVLCLHLSAKKSLNAKTQTQSQKERLMSHPFYHLLILIKHSSEWTLCWGPNSTSSDLYRKPPWILVFSTISEVDFQLFSSLLTRSFQNGLLCHVRISWCMYIYIYTNVYIQYLYVCMVQYGPTLFQTPAIFTETLPHDWHLRWTVSSIGAKVVFRVEGKWGQNVVSNGSFYCEVKKNVAKNQTSTLVMAAKSLSP